LEDLETVLTEKFSTGIGPEKLDQVSEYEVEFSARIAGANGLELSPTTEALVALSDSRSADYITRGLPSADFVNNAIKEGHAKTYCALLDQILKYPDVNVLTSSQLSNMQGRFEIVLEEAIQEGRNRNTPIASAIHLEDAVRLLRLSDVVGNTLVARSAIKLRPSEVEISGHLHLPK